MRNLEEILDWVAGESQTTDNERVVAEIWSSSQRVQRR